MILVHVLNVIIFKPATVAQHVAHPLIVRGGIGSNLDPKQKQAQLITMHSKHFSDKSSAIKGLVVCWMLLNLISTSGR